MRKIILILFLSYSWIATSALAESLSATEKQIIAHVSATQSQALDFLREIVNVNSGTENVTGVYEVGERVRKEFEKIGFASEWKNPPESMKRAGTLLLTRKGSADKHILLIAHLDTVYAKDHPSAPFSHEGNVAKGPGVADAKGGVVIILYALKALEKTHSLQDATITVALTGDEENAGRPVSISRAALIQAAQGADVVLDFEPASSSNEVTLSRRGITTWTLKTTGREAHSSTIFQPATGYGAIFELARVLEQGQKKLANEPYATFNPGVIAGGTTATIETEKAKSSGKMNVVAQIALAHGDIRFLSEAQKKSMQQTLIEITQHSLAGTTAEFTFQEVMPPMQPTENNKHLLEQYSQVSRDLNYGAVKAVDPRQRGAADINYVAPIVPANLGGLGPIGADTHTANETVDIPSLNVNTQRAAVLIYRLIQ